MQVNLQLAAQQSLVNTAYHSQTKTKKINNTTVHKI